MSLLRIHEVDAFYDSAQILEAVSLQIDRGEKVAVLGRNGVGKSTLINTLLGVARVGAGSIEMQGKTFHKIKTFDAVHHGIAVVPQGRRIIPTLTVTENLMMGAASGRTGNWNLESVLDLFPILRERAIVMANPDLLILDEPSEGLAPVIVDQLIDLLNQLADQGTSIMLVEQNISFVLDVVQRYCVLSKGRVVEQGSSVGLTVENLKKYISV